jgi:phytoene synthase
LQHHSQLAQVRADKKQFFGANSRSFSFASLGFRASERKLVQSVYAFCRITDDLVDEHVADDKDEIDRDLDAWISVTRDSFNGVQGSGIAWLDDLMHESSVRGVPFDVIEGLVEGVRSDTALSQLDTLQDLRSYCYGVASTVGIWMCHLFGVKEPLMLERAAALGRAMQTTNILRDVGDDLTKGRVYIPLELLHHFDLSISDLISAQETGTVPERYDELVRHLMNMADEDYERGWDAIPHLPGPFARAAAVAADVYHGIHREIEKNGFDNFTKRARTGSLRKVVLMLKALTRLWTSRCGFPGKKIRTLGSSGENGSGPTIRQSILTIMPFVFLLVGQTNAQVSNPIIEDVRDRYWGSAQAENIDSVQALLRSEPELRLDPIAVAYDAALEILKAKHAFWPPKKLEHVNNGLPVLDSLVTSHPSLVEPRYLRMLSCYFLPSILKREWSVEEDIRELATRLPDAGAQVPIPQYKKMLRFLLQNGELVGTTQYDELMAALTEVYEEDRNPDPGSSK